MEDDPGRSRRAYADAAAVAVAEDQKFGPALPYPQVDAAGSNLFLETILRPLRHDKGRSQASGAARSRELRGVAGRAVAPLTSELSLAHRFDAVRHSI